MWDLFFSFFNGIPYMTESDKKGTPSVWDISLARLLGSASWARPGGSPQWAVLGRLLRGARGLRFCSLRLYVEAGVEGRPEILTACSTGSWGSPASPHGSLLFPFPAGTTGSRRQPEVRPVSGFDFFLAPTWARGL